MRHSHKKFLFLVSLLIIPSVSLAESKDEKFAFEKSPGEKVECNWSKMSSEEYKACKERKKYFGHMSDDEKDQHNKNVERRWNGEDVKPGSGKKSRGDSGEGKNQPKAGEDTGKDGNPSPSPTPGK